MQQLFLILCILCVPSLSEGKNLWISKTSTPPFIDGVGNDAIWDSLTWEDIDQPKEDVTGFNAQFKMCYNQDNIYILVKVTDPTPMQDGYSTWQSDCVELFFAMDTNSSSNYRPGDWQLRKIASKSQVDGGIDGGNGLNGYSPDISPMLNDPNFIVEQTDYNSTYIQEWQIPINTLVQSANFNGAAFRYDMQIANSDGSGMRIGQLFWNSTADDQWSSVLHQGYVFLSDKIIVNPPQEEAIITMQNSATYIIDSTTWFYDSGGPNYYYKDNEYKIVTIYPKKTGYSLKVNFSYFETESYYDKLQVYDGENTRAPLIGSFTGYTNIEEIISSNPKGALTFVFSSDGSITYRGFKASITPFKAKISPPNLNLAFYDTLSLLTLDLKGYQWILYENANWLSLSKTVGSDSTTVEVRTTVNPGATPRTTNITVTLIDSASNVEQEIVKVTQQRQDNYVTANIDSIFIDGKRDTTIAFTINSNTSNWGAYIYDWRFNYNYKQINTNTWEFQVIAPKNTSIREVQTSLIIYWYDLDYNSKSISIPIIQSMGECGIDKSQLSFNYQADSLTFNIISGGKAWSISSYYNWITVNPQSGTNDTVITVKVARNPYAYSRTGEIAVNFPEQYGYITIDQGGAPAYFYIPDTIYLSYKDTILTIGNANCSWYVNMSSSDWLSAYANDTLIIAYARMNSLINKRTCGITINYATNDWWQAKTVIFVQSPAPYGISTDRLTLSHQIGDAKHFNIITDKNWSITTNADWLEVSSTSGNGNASINVSTKADNNNRESRETLISIKFAGDVTDRTIQVVQNGAPIIFSTAPPSINLTFANPSQFLMIQSNIRWYINYVPSFVKTNNTSGPYEGDASLVVEFIGYPYEYQYDYIEFMDDNFNNIYRIPVTFVPEAIVPDSYLSIYKINSPIVIDGKGEEVIWTKIDSNAIAQANGKTENFSANFKMCYDENNIYLLVKVYDPTPNQVGELSWHSDNVELFFAMDTANSSYYRPGDWQIRKIAAKSKAEGGIDGSSNVSEILLNDSNFMVAQTDGNGYYIQEWQLPIKTLVQSAFFNRLWFRFDIQVADNDGSSQYRTGQLFWNSNFDDQWGNIYHQGYVKMAGPIDQLTFLSNSSVAYKAIDNRKDTVFINTKEWFQITSDQSWIHFAEEVGMLSRYLIIWVDNNTRFSPRTGTIKLSNPNYELIITVTQDAYSSVIALRHDDITFYPNPVIDWLNIATTNQINSLKIFNLDGKLLLSTRPNAPSNRINLSRLKTGFYLMQITFSDGSVIQKKIQKK